MMHRHGVALGTPEDQATAEALEAYRRTCEAAGRVPAADVSTQIVRSDELAANGEYLVVVRD